MYVKDFNLPVNRFFFAEHGFCGDRKYEHHKPTEQALDVCTVMYVKEAKEAYVQRGVSRGALASEICG